MNNTRSHVSIFLATLSLLSIPALCADEVQPKDPAAKKPVNYCIVSGEHLQPGDIVTYVYKEEGKPDLTLRFCCHKCVARFKADPQRYLKKLDADSAQPAKDGE